MGKLNDITDERRSASDEILNAASLNVAGEQEIETPVRKEPTDGNHLRSVVLAGVANIRIGMQPFPLGPEKLPRPADRALLDRHSEQSGRLDQFAGSAARLADRGLEHGRIQDQSFGGESREYRGHRREVIEVRMAHDDRLDASHSRSPQGRNRRADSERAQVETSRIEDHGPFPATKDMA